jgi:hypothetical protein
VIEQDDSLVRSDRHEFYASPGRPGSPTFSSTSTSTSGATRNCCSRSPMWWPGAGSDPPTGAGGSLRSSVPFGPSEP